MLDFSVRFPVKWARAHRGCSPERRLHITDQGGSTMVAINLPPEHVLHQLFAYDNGRLYWRAHNDMSHSRNAHYAGKRAGSAFGGYRRVHVGPRSYLEHRIIFKLLTGVEPIADIDHVNGDKADNRIENLREATRAENCRSLHRARRDNHSSGVLGVHRLRGKWRVRIMKDGKSYFFGYYATIAEASAVAVRERKNLFGEYAGTCSV